MLTPITFSLKRGRCLWLICIIALCVLCVNLGPQIVHFVRNVADFGVADEHVSARTLQPNLSKRSNKYAAIRIIYQAMDTKRDVLTSKIYTSNKTNFEDAFPPFISTASTLHAKFSIGNFEICQDADQIDYIVVVHSAVSNFDRRQAIRFTWGRTNLIQGVSSRTVFLTGQTEDRKTQAKVLFENDSYGDIVQGKFLDTYNNLTLKNVLGLRWVSNYCSGAKMVIKVDDDVFLDIFSARERYFTNLLTSPRQLICKVGAKNHIFRSDFAKEHPFIKKWAVANDYFKGLEYYPMPFCFGFVVIMSTEMVQELYQAAQATPLYPLDDVYVFGILASTVQNSSWRNEEDRFAPIQSQTLSKWGCCHRNALIAGTFRSEMMAQKLWNTTITCFVNRLSYIKEYSVIS